MKKQIVFKKDDTDPCMWRMYVEEPDGTIYLAAIVQQDMMFSMGCQTVFHSPRAEYKATIEMESDPDYMEK